MIAVIGGTVVLIGLLLGPLPFVPAVILIPLGLAILATEFVWAQRLLRTVRERMHLAQPTPQAPDLAATNPVDPPASPSSPKMGDEISPALADGKLPAGLLDPVEQPPPCPPDKA